MPWTKYSRPKKTSLSFMIYHQTWPSDWADTAVVHWSGHCHPSDFGGISNGQTDPDELWPEMIRQCEVQGYWCWTYVVVEEDTGWLKIETAPACSLKRMCLYGCFIASLPSSVTSNVKPANVSPLRVKRLVYLMYMLTIMVNTFDFIIYSVSKHNCDFTRLTFYWQV